MNKNHPQIHYQFNQILLLFFLRNFLISFQREIQRNRYSWRLSGSRLIYNQVSIQMKSKKKKKERSPVQELHAETHPNIMDIFQRKLKIIPQLHNSKVAWEIYRVRNRCMFLNLVSPCKLILLAKISFFQSPPLRFINHRTLRSPLKTYQSSEGRVH